MSNEDRRAELQRLIALTEPHVQANRRAHCFWPEDEFFGRLGAIADPVERVREWYMHGNCSVFAAVLHERTGWPVCGLYAPPGKPGREGVAHWVCRTPEGLYADARGVRAEAEIVAEYARPHDRTPLVILQSTLEDLVTRFRRPAANYEAARQEHLDLLLPDLIEMERAYERGRPFRGI